MLHWRRAQLASSPSFYDRGRSGEGAGPFLGACKRSQSVTQNSPRCFVIGDDQVPLIRGAARIYENRTHSTMSYPSCSMRHEEASKCELKPFTRVMKLWLGDLDSNQD